MNVAAYLTIRGHLRISSWRGAFAASYLPTIRTRGARKGKRCSTSYSLIPLETITFVDHKKRIAEAKAFAHFVTEQTTDIDRKIEHIRRGLEAEMGRVFDFYDKDVRIQWDPAATSNGNLWDEFVQTRSGIC